MKKELEVIRIEVGELSSLFNPYDSMDISNELAEYIEKRCSRISKSKIEIDIISKEEIDKDKREKIVDAIRRHYGLEIKHISRANKKMQIANILYFIAGIFIILLDSIVYNYMKFVIPEIINILGWVIIWESCFNLLFTDHQMDLTVSMARKIEKCHINFK